MKRIVLALFGIIFLILAGVYIFSRVNQTPSTTDTSEVSEATESSTAATKVTESTESTEPTTTTTSEEPLVDQILSEMTLEEKVGQLFFVRTPEINQIADIQTYHLGGFVLFGRDVENETRESLIQKINDFQAASHIPLLIGADEEGGTVTRISRNPNLVETPFAAPQTIYANGGWEAIREDTTQKAAILNDYGINTGLFPVADVATDPNAFIYDRTIGMDTAGTSRFVETVVRALHAAQSGSTLKHFPGYGNNLDSHLEIVVDNRSLDELRQNDFPSFHAGIAAGADSILVAHNIVTSIDATVPASISPTVHQLLREEFGFDGVIMTDDMDMAGLADFISQEEAGLAALKAGNDLVMSSSYQTQIPRVIQALENGEYSTEQLEKSVRRVLLWKQHLGLLD